MKHKLAWFVASLLLVLALALAAPAVAQPAGNGVWSPRLTGEIEYTYAGHLGLYDGEGRMLLWVGTITGDLNGTMKWWFLQPPPFGVARYKDGRVVYYAGRWEIWDGETLLLAGESSGKTVIPAGQDGMWDGAGVVTEAHGRYNVLKGRHIYETGPVIFGGLPYGTGIFSVF
jgi:hypothetical protein